MTDDTVIKFIGPIEKRAMQNDQACKRACKQLDSSLNDCDFIIISIPKDRNHRPKYAVTYTSLSTVSRCISTLERILRSKKKENVGDILKHGLERLVAGDPVDVLESTLTDLKEARDTGSLPDKYKEIHHEV